ncbi:enoyl-CoA hydratase/isomerase family protein [Neobacillus niacini]|uniref:enoyl-CoA hydratase/isomerase family protein n=1 Tax=Neobacillus niacini TaxID=86668 RepID=UPI00203D75EF|nr:enoyl-CoA hydratase [Neobacillus niacini]MCM3691206.1 enoyl-CoA hydratase [Neobacillus niacini]
MEENKHLLVDIQDGVMKLTLNRPDSLNALSDEMIKGLTETFHHARNNPAVRVITIQGAGRAFCAGGDIKGMGKNTPSGTHEFLGRVNEAILAVRNVEKPVIAVVHGYAAGVGFSLAMACDLIVATEDSKFIMSFAKIGLIVDGGGSYFLPRLVGAQRAKELLFTGEPITAATAYNWGIVNRVYNTSDFSEKAGQFISQFVDGPGKSYEMTKKLVNQSFTSDLNQMLELERVTQSVMEQTSDFHEGIEAFKEKRKPNFEGN